MSDRFIKLTAQSKRLRNIPYIVELFKKQIPGEREEFAMFYTYYQVIEILISVVFEIRFREILNTLNEDADNLFDKREDLNEIASEKNRIKWLFRVILRKLNCLFLDALMDIILTFDVSRTGKES